MPRRLFWLTLTVIVSLSTVLYAPAPSSTEAATASSLNLLYIAEDRFYNYDFTSQSVAYNGVDWTVDLLFWNNAEVDKVKNALNVDYSETGDPMYMLLSDYDPYFAWDQDSGRKTYICPVVESAVHYRIYADADDQLYNVSWGYYTIATSHYDTRECGVNRWYGRSEDTEAHIAASSRRVWGYSAVAEDSSWFYNAESYREEGNHYWLNDGNATTIRVP